MSDQREPVLSLRDLRVEFDTPNGMVQAVRGVDLDLHAGEILGVVGESGSGKSVTFLGMLGLLPKSAQITGLGQGERRRTGRRIDEHDAIGARSAGVDDLPGSAVGAESRPSGRRPDRRDDPCASGRVEEVGGGNGDRPARYGRHPATEGPHQPVSARVLGRHASACDDRHGDRQRPPGADRRRAHDGARRHGAGADPRGDRSAAAGDAHGRRA